MAFKRSAVRSRLAPPHFSLLQPSALAQAIFDIQMARHGKNWAASVAPAPVRRPSGAVRACTHWRERPEPWPDSMNMESGLVPEPEDGANQGELDCVIAAVDQE